MKDSLYNSLLICSKLLEYPDEKWLTSFGEIREMLRELPKKSQKILEPFINYVSVNDSISLQELYVSTFDMSKDDVLHITYPLYKDEITRGSALVRLKQIYRTTGFEPITEELPDYLPMVLEFLAFSDNKDLKRYIRDYIPFLSEFVTKLKEKGNLYSSILEFCLNSLEEWVRG